VLSAVLRNLASKMGLNVGSLSETAKRIR